MLDLTVSTKRTQFFSYSSMSYQSATFRQSAIEVYWLLTKPCTDGNSGGPGTKFKDKKPLPVIGAGIDTLVRRSFDRACPLFFSSHRGSPSAGVCLRRCRLPVPVHR